MPSRKKRKTNTSSSSSSSKTVSTQQHDSSSQDTDNNTNVKIEEEETSTPTTPTNIEDDQEVQRRIDEYLSAAVTYWTLLSKQQDQDFTTTTTKSSPTSDSLIPDDPVWSNPIAEITLFETIEQFPPLGEHLPFSLINVYTALRRKGLPNTPSMECIHKHLLSLYNLERLREDADFKWDRQEFQLPPEMINEVGDQIDVENTQIGSKRNKKTSQKGSRKRQRKRK